MISVIIPTFNEAAELPATLASVAAATRFCDEPDALANRADEVIVADAGSTDATVTIAVASGAQVITSAQRQRAAQLNLGAAHARGETLLFLHADTRLAPGALAALQRALVNPATLGGGYARRYDAPSALLRITCALAELRTRCFGWFLGDQAIFARRSAFEKLGGFREWDIFEDLDFSRRLARSGRVVTLRPPVISAGRRFARRGAARTTWSDLCLTIRYLAAATATASRNGRENRTVHANPAFFS